MESKITNDDIDIIWQAAQLKHCSKQVFDLLAPLIKNLEPAPVTHLYHLLYKMEPKDHTEQVDIFPVRIKLANFPIFIVPLHGNFVEFIIGIFDHKVHMVQRFDVS